MSKIKSILFILITLPMCSYAQVEVKDTTSVNAQDANKAVEFQAIDVEGLQKQIKELTAKVNVLTESENNLRGIQYDNERKIKEQETIIKRLEKRLLFADTVIARISNNCLLKKYDPKNVNDAIVYFEGMYSNDLKSKFSRLKTLLMEYGSYTKELGDIFIEAQNDKALGNPFTGQNQAMTYIDKIKSTTYYREVYDENWTIPYLNSVIDRSIEVIKSFNPKDSKELHLMELME
jgi:hypothetical protein